MTKLSLLSVLLTVLFIALKLTDVITWAWVWVISPLWIPIASVILIAILILLYTALFVGEG